MSDSDDFGPRRRRARHGRHSRGVDEMGPDLGADELDGADVEPLRRRRPVARRVPDDSGYAPAPDSRARGRRRRLDPGADDEPPLAPADPPRASADPDAEPRGRRRRRAPEDESAEPAARWADRDDGEPPRRRRR
ncbi:hypothetical protein DEF24_24985, partial [Marinitenerispora sediminis]